MKWASMSKEQLAEFKAIFNGFNEPRDNKKRKLVWESALGEFELGDYQVIPLTNSRALRQEGRAMNNCVGTYDEYCSKGRVRVFSIRDLAGNRVATMSLIFLSDNWHLEQIKGIANGEICTSEEVYYDGERTVTQLDMTDFHYIAHDVLRCYRKACEKDLLKLIFDAATAGGKSLCKTKS